MGTVLFAATAIVLAVLGYREIRGYRSPFTGIDLFFDNLRTGASGGDWVEQPRRWRQAVRGWMFVGLAALMLVAVVVTLG